MERLVRFNVLGHEYPLYTDVPEEDVDEILQFVRSHFERHTKNSKQLLSAKIAILVCLNMAGEYIKLKREFEQYKSQTVNNVDNLSEKIERLIE